MKTLLLIPSVRKHGIGPAMAAGRHPRMDYDALADALCAEGGVDVLDYAALDAERHPLVRAASRLFGRDAALAVAGFVRRDRYGAVFTNGENVGIPLALLLRRAGRRTLRPGHVTIGHRLSSPKKTPFFRRLRAHDGMDTVFVYAGEQARYARAELGIPPGAVRQIAFHADERFWRPRPEVPVKATQICAAGLEWRDYPTLIRAVAGLPDVCVTLAAASPWSKHADQTRGGGLPPNVHVARFDYAGLRDLYAASAAVVVPLRENDFQAGVTTLLEAMAMGKPVIATQTTGQTDVIAPGENGLFVPPGDVEGWRRAIRGLLDDPARGARLGQNARRWVERHATLDRWVGEIAGALRRCTLASPRWKEAK